MSNPGEHFHKEIPHSRPTLGQEEMEAAGRVILSGQVSQGNEVEKFEASFGSRMNTGFAAAVNSGTSALHLALLSLDIGAGMEVIIPSYVCTALLNVVKYVGAEPVLAEIDPDTFNLDPGDVKKRLTKRTGAIILPHMFGLTADTDSFLDLGVPVIEDCAQALGGTYKAKALGTSGCMAIFSFYATKVMTTGEGGMVLSSSKTLIDRVKDLREYDQNENYGTRYNYKMTDIQAAIGAVQLSRLDEFIQKRRAIARKYSMAFRDLDLRLPPDDPDHIYYRYILGLNEKADPWIRALREKGINCSKPVHKPIHMHLGLGRYSISENAWSNSLSIPIYPSLTDQNAEQVISEIRESHGKR